MRTADRKEFGCLFDRVRELFGTRSAHTAILRSLGARWSLCPLFFSRR